MESKKYFLTPPHEELTGFFFATPGVTRTYNPLPLFMPY